MAMVLRLVLVSLINSASEISRAGKAGIKHLSVPFIDYTACWTGGDMYLPATSIFS